MELALLVVVCLLLGVAIALLWLQRSRLSAVEEKLREIGTLAFLPDRVQALAKELEALAVDDVRAELDQLHKDLVRLEDIVSVPATAPATPPSRDQVVRAAVTRYLREEGFLSVVLMDEESDFTADPAVVQISALRNGVQMRGSVEVQGDMIGAVELDPSYTSFP
ncbi:MAG: hypothetical protein GY747_09680 [Planctomycetes bacterium]|nr:hypothetical protein [Planctomycetota bacterium]MCP4771663.1 hypothetical protein [Planctomycetota bacterium]MCP4860037.1 hypothetical protein [Planctomycetota bacterium]